MRIFSDIGASFSRLWSDRENLSFRNFRPAKIHYVLAYAFELALYSTQGQYIEVETPILGISPFMLMYVGHVLFSLVVMLLWSDRFKPLVRVSSWVLLLAFFPFLLLGQGIPKTVFAMITWAGLGGCVTSARCGYAFAANNVERLAGILLAFLTSFVFFIVKGLALGGMVMTHILPTLFMIGLVFALSRYKEGELEARTDSRPADRRAVFIAMAYMIGYYAIDGYAWGLISNDALSFNVLVGLGGIIASAVFILVLTLFKKSMWHMWNIIFVFALIMALLGMAPEGGVFDAPKHLFIGLTLVGAPASLYMLGGAQRRFASYKLLKQCTVAFALLLPLTTLSDDIIEGYFPRLLPVVTLILVLAAFIAFTLASPYSFKYLFSTGWMEDYRRKDMTQYWEKVEDADRFAKYGLTRREKEVAVLLLSANTVRMISGELKIAESTVKMHTSNLYRKLNINSRAELFRLFGVSEPVEVSGAK
jgi:DNA-binding CsgD family transcriptional regulator